MNTETLDDQIAKKRRQIWRIGYLYLPAHAVLVSSILVTGGIFLAVAIPSMLLNHTQVLEKTNWPLTFVMGIAGGLIGKGIIRIRVSLEKKVLTLSEEIFQLEIEKARVEHQVRIDSYLDAHPNVRRVFDEFD